MVEAVMEQTEVVEKEKKRTNKKSAKKAAQSQETRTTKKKSTKTAEPNGDENLSPSSGKASSANVEAKPVKKAVKGKRPLIVYEEEAVFLYKLGNDNGPLTVTLAKQLLGWQEEVGEIKFGKDFLFRDRLGKKIRCTNNLTNRPFYASLAEGWMMEILHGRWRLNGENIVADRTGMIQDGQHRLVGLVWAAQEWEAHTDRWTDYWRAEPWINASVFVGIDEKDETVNTIGTGKPRSLTDVIFRSALFSSLTNKERHRAARVASYTTKLLWLRTGANLDAYSASRAHSEALNFIERHPKMLECISFCIGEDDEKRLSKMIPLGYISALLYLFGCAASDYDEYIREKSETVLDWSLWDKACEFIVGLAAGEEIMDPLRAALNKMDSTGSLARDEGCGLIVNGWNAYLEDETIDDDSIRVLMTTNELGHPCLESHPLVGGIDCGPVGAENRADLEEEEEV